MTPYQLFLLAVMLVWPFVIVGMLWLMSRLEEYVKRIDASTPEEAGLEPVAGSPPEREVRIVFGDRVIGDAEVTGEPARSPTA